MAVALYSKHLPTDVLPRVNTVSPPRALNSSLESPILPPSLPSLSTEAVESVSFVLLLAELLKEADFSERVDSTFRCAITSELTHHS